jgi:hypothetical protein
VHGIVLCADTTLHKHVVRDETTAHSFTEGKHMNTRWLRDPTAETSAVKRPRVKPPQSLQGLTVALFDIGKTRSDEFLDQLEKRLADRGVETRRYAKPTNTKVAPVEVMQKVATEADAVVIALSD